MTSYLVDCKWSEFGSWSDCSVTCGEGTKSATRKILHIALNGGRDCEGDSTRVNPCNLGECPGKEQLLIMINNQ